ncbi:hypothetical protein F511_20470 [Dorcoceras hygrometricum]|uniref:Uncharacterized protein n=1 Tax=Dorcoceras hygrometricum TaxID=472368 RepID=A0A2Z7B3T9_9LAMI|nr:hypothetical protein F511_20470 [Dorcoceras hygrometricum]
MQPTRPEDALCFWPPSSSHPDGAPLAGPPPGPAAPTQTIHGPNYGRTRENEPWPETKPRRQNSRRIATRNHLTAAAAITQRAAHGRTLAAPCADDIARPRAWTPTRFTGNPALQVGGGRFSLIRSTTGIRIPSSVYTRRSEKFDTNGIFSSRRSEQVQSRQAAARAAAGGGAWVEARSRGELGGGAAAIGG